MPPPPSMSFARHLIRSSSSKTFLLPRLAFIMAAVVLVLTVHLIRPTPALVDLEEDSILEEESMLGITGKGSRVDADSLAAGDKQTAKRGRAAAGGGKARTRARSRGGGAALPADANDASAADLFLKLAQSPSSSLWFCRPPAF